MFSLQYLKGMFQHKSVSLSTWKSSDLDYSCTTLNSWPIIMVCRNNSGLSKQCYIRKDICKCKYMSMTTFLVKYRTIWRESIFGIYRTYFFKEKRVYSKTIRNNIEQKFIQSDKTFLKVPHKESSFLCSALYIARPEICI